MKIKSDRLIKKYGKTNLCNERYQALMNEIITNNNEAISRAILRQSKSNWDSGLKKITTKEKQFIMPSVENVLPKRSIFVNKGAEHGKFIVDTLKDRLTKDLRESLNQFTAKTGEQRYITRRGKRAGLINPKVVKDFRNAITNTFENYTKKDPKYGVPSNIRNIAVTEVRSTIDTMKYKYGETLLEKNKDLEAWKVWRHNPNLSKEYRKGHHEADGQRVKFNQDFIIRDYKKIKGKDVYQGTVRMQYPHAQGIPLDQLIGCNCDYYIIVIRKNK